MLLAKKNLEEYTELDMTEKKLNPLLSSLNRENLDNNSTMLDLELQRRNQAKTLLF